MRFINTLLSKELWFTLLLCSGFFKQYILLYKSDAIDFTLVVGAIILVLYFLEARNSQRANLIGREQLMGILLVFAFAFCVFVSIFYTASDRYFITKLLSFFVCLYIYVIPILSNNFDIKKFQKYLVITSLGIAVTFIVLHPIISDNQSLSIIKDNYLVVGYLCGLNILFLLENAKQHKLTIICFVIILFLTGARGPILFTVVLSIFALLSKRGVLTLIGPKAIFALIFAGALFWGLSGSLEFVREMYESSLNRFTLLFSENKGESANIRISHIYESWHLISEKPVLGYGLGSYGFVTTGNDIRAYPHNALLEIWFEVGVFGLITFCILCLYHLFLTTKYAGFFAFCLLTYILLNALKSSSFAELKFLFGFFSIFLTSIRSELITKKKQLAN